VLAGTILKTGSIVGHMYGLYQLITHIKRMQPDLAGDFSLGRNPSMVNVIHPSV
jgi:hypothetical protein